MNFWIFNLFILWISIWIFLSITILNNKWIYLISERMNGGVTLEFQITTVTYTHIHFNIYLLCCWRYEFRLYEAEVKLINWIYVMTKRNYDNHNPIKRNCHVVTKRNLQCSPVLMLCYVFVWKHKDGSVCSRTFTKWFRINKIKLLFLELTKSKIHKAVDTINSLTVIYWM